MQLTQNAGSRKLERLYGGLAFVKVVVTDKLSIRPIIVRIFLPSELLALILVEFIGTQVFICFVSSSYELISGHFSKLP